MKIVFILFHVITCSDKIGLVSIEVEAYALMWMKGCLVQPDRFKLLNRCNDDIEAQWLLSVKGKSKRSLICNIYRPPSGSLINFCDTLKALLLQVDDIAGYDVFVIGDFNVNALANSNEKNLLFETLDQFNLIQIINSITTTSGSNTCTVKSRYKEGLGTRQICSL